MAMFRHSVSQVFPEYLEVITSNDYNKSFVKITKDSSQQIPTHDITCNIPKLLFWHAYRMQHQAVSSSCKNNKLKKRKREVRKRVITIVSDYGTTTTGVSARDLGMKILQAIPIELIADASLADIRLSEGNSGSIHIVTMKHFRSQGEKGFVLCPSCGKFVRGEQGLWWHQKMVHGSDHTQAKEVAAAQISSMALVPFDNVETSPEIGRGGGGSKATQPHQPPMKRQRKEEQPQPKRKTLSPGMEACKNGDFETLKNFILGLGFKLVNKNISPQNIGILFKKSELNNTLISNQYINNKQLILNYKENIKNNRIKIQSIGKELNKLFNNKEVNVVFGCGRPLDAFIKYGQLDLDNFEFLVDNFLSMITDKLYNKTLKNDKDLKKLDKVLMLIKHPSKELISKLPGNPEVILLKELLK